MYKIKQFFVFLLLAGGLLSSCKNNDFKTTESGIKYRFIEEGSGEMPEPGQVMTLNMIYKDSKDSILFNTLDHGEPMPMPVDSTWSDDGSIYEVFKMMKVGDSVEIKITTGDFFSKTVKQPMPDSLDAEGMITFNVGVEDVMSMEDFRAYQMEQFQKRQEEAAAKSVEQLKKDEEIIDQYLEENNITAQKTESGLRYQILEEGNGPKAEKGDTAVVDFTGLTLEGELFYTSNMEKAKEHGTFEEGAPYEPLTFVIGAGQMIRGVDEGVALLKEGAKARLFLPSPLAYGERGAGQDIKPNQVLSFEIELIDLKSK